MSLNGVKSATRLHHFLTMVPLGTLLNLSMAPVSSSLTQGENLSLEMFVYFEVRCANGSYSYVLISVPCVTKHSIRKTLARTHHLGLSKSPGLPLTVLRVLSNSVTPRSGLTQAGCTGQGSTTIVAAMNTEQL